MREQILKSIRTTQTLSDYIPESYTGIYSMHKYWSKKPFNIIHKYIEQYTVAGDVVLDTFSGSGISNIETILLGRKAIGIDINPMSIFIIRQTLSRIDPHKVEEKFLEIKHNIGKKINALYRIRRTGKTFTGSHFIYKNDVLTEIWYNNSDGKVIDAPKPSDLRLHKTFAYEDIKYRYPKQKLIKNSRINVKEGMSVYDLFTPRNTLALSMLLSEIDRIEDLELRDFFRFCFTSCSGQASKMVFVINNRNKMKNVHSQPGRKEVGSWVIGYWIPKEHFEINAWNCFENRYKKILRAKIQYNKIGTNIRYARSFSGLQRKNNTWLINDSCHSALQKIPDNSIDYVITDPPHGDRLPYLELSMMWNDWLGFDANMRDELVISDAKTRNKSISQYSHMLEEILSEINRVLKPDKYFTLIFNNYDDRTWRDLQDMLFVLDFKLTDIGTVGYSAASVVQDSRNGGLKTDFVLTFQKTKNSKKTERKMADRAVIDRQITEYLEKKR